MKTRSYWNVDRKMEMGPHIIVETGYHRNIETGPHRIVKTRPHWNMETGKLLENAQ